jgi:hypothetical protein
MDDDASEESLREERLVQTATVGSAAAYPSGPDVTWYQFGAQLTRPLDRDYFSNFFVSNRSTVSKRAF